MGFIFIDVDTSDVSDLSVRDAQNSWCGRYINATSMLHAVGITYYKGFYYVYTVRWGAGLIALFTTGATTHVAVWQLLSLYHRTSPSSLLYTLILSQWMHIYTSFEQVNIQYVCTVFLHFEYTLPPYTEGLLWAVSPAPCFTIEKSTKNNTDIVSDWRYNWWLVWKTENNIINTFSPNLCHQCFQPWKVCTDQSLVEGQEMQTCTQIYWLSLAHTHTNMGMHMISQQVDVR